MQTETPVPAQKLLEDGVAAIKAGRQEDAIRILQEAVALAENTSDVPRQAKALYHLTGVYQALRQYPKALDTAQKALLLYRQIGDRSGEADALNDLGGLSRVTGDPEQALIFLGDALKIRRELGDRASEANTLTNIGNVYGATGRYTEAREYYQKSLPIHQATKNQRGEANTLSNIGTIYRLTSQFQEARSHYQKALVLRQTIHDVSGEASSYYNIGTCHKAVGEYLQALEMYNRALEIQERQESSANTVTTLAGLASLYYAMAQPEKSLPLYQKIYLLREASSDLRGQGTAATNLGNVYSTLRETTKALEYYDKALFLHRQTKNISGEADTLNGIGNLYNGIHQLEGARVVFGKALVLYRQLENKAGEADALSNLGKNSYLQKQYKEAIEYYQKALPTHQLLRNQDSEITTWDNLGDAYLAIQKPQQALDAMQRTIALLERVHGSLGPLTESKTDFLGAHLKTYHRTITLLLQFGRKEEAFGLAQRTKGRALAEMIDKGGFDRTSLLTVAERQQVGLLREQSASLNQQMITEAIQNLPGSKKRYDALGQQLKEVETRLSVLADQQAVRHPVLAQLQPPSPLTVRELARLLPADTAMIELTVTEKPLAFVVTRQGLVVQAIAANEANLTQQINTLRASCIGTDGDQKRPGRDANQLLIAPLKQHLNGIKRLIFCPEGIFWDIPYSLLSAEGFSVSLAQSATLWKRTQKSHVTRKTQDTILVYANPSFGTAERFASTPLIPDRPIKTPDRPIKTPDRPIKTPDRPIKTPDRDLLQQLQDGTLSSLVGTEVEAKAITRHFPRSVVRVGNAAQEATFKKEAGNFRILHLASHAFLNDAAPLLSSIILAAPHEPSGEDGFLTAREILELPLNSDLAVLSACNTGRGEKRVGEGMIGLTWALQAAGVREQIVAQWPVDDAATAALMGSFYAHLKMGKGTAESLLQAILYLRNTPKWQHPHFWAPFVLIGGSR